MSNNLPPGVTERMIDEAMGGYEPTCSYCGKECDPEELEPLNEFADSYSTRKRLACPRCVGDYERAQNNEDR